jgi:hypothetical protein
MTSCALVTEPSSLDRSLLDQVPEDATLDELMTSLWERLTAHRTVTCPACGEEMGPDYAAHARPIGGSCTGCGSTVR